MAHEIGHVVGFLSSMGTHLVRWPWNAVRSILLVLEEVIVFTFSIKMNSPTFLRILSR